MSVRKSAFDALKTKFDGIDESVLSRVASSLSKTAKSEEEVLEKVEDMTLQGVINSYTDSRVSDASEKAVKTYEERFGLKDGKLAEKTSENADEGATKKVEESENDMPSYVKSIMETMSSLKAELDNMKGQKSAETRKSTFEDAIKDAPERLQKSLRREFSRSQFKDEDDFASWMDEISPEIAEASNTATAKSAVVSQPKGGGGSVKGQVNPLVLARIDARSNEAATAPSAIKGLPSNN